MNEKNKPQECANAPGHGLTAKDLERAVRICGSKKNGGSGCFGCPLQGVTRCVNRLFEALAAENERLREENRWIPVGERLPKKSDASGDGEVLAVWVEEKVMDPSPKICSESCAQPWEYVAQHPAWFSHWKPMPEGPEVGHD